MNKIVILSLVIISAIILFTLYFALRLYYYSNKPKLQFHNNEIESGKVVFGKRKILPDEVIK